MQPSETSGKTFENLSYGIEGTLFYIELWLDTDVIRIQRRNGVDIETFQVSIEEKDVLSFFVAHGSHAGIGTLINIFFTGCDWISQRIPEGSFHLRLRRVLGGRTEPRSAEDLEMITSLFTQLLAQNDPDSTCIPHNRPGCEYEQFEYVSFTLELRAGPRPPY